MFGSFLGGGQEKEKEADTEKQFYLAQISFEAKDYEESLKNFQDILKVKKYDLTPEELKLFRKIVITLIDQYRSPLIDIYSKTYKDKEEDLVVVKLKQKTLLESEMQNVCKKIIPALENILIKKAERDETKSFYWTLKGMCYRYSAELKQGKEQQNFLEESKKSFNTAKGLISKLNPIDYYRLFFDLHYGLFLYEAADDKEGSLGFFEEEVKEINKTIALNKPQLSEDNIELIKNITEKSTNLKNIISN